jgi:hypothetical protein
MRMTFFGRGLAFFSLLGIMAACSVDRFPLPSVSNVAETGFGAGDTTFLMLNKHIDLGEGADPGDIFINDDGHIYVAETGRGAVSVWDQALNPLSEAGLEDFQLDGIKGVCVSPEQLFCAVAGDSAIWTVNLQANREELVWGLDRLIGISPEGVRDTLNAAEIASEIESYRLNRWDIESVDSLDLSSEEFQARLGQRIFWYGSGSTRLDGVAKGRPGYRELFVINNNSFNNRINRIRFVPSAILFTTNPDVPVVYLYEAITAPEVAIAEGTGVGTMDEGLFIDADELGNVYFTQAAPTIGYWKVQRLAVEEFAGIDYWSFDFGLQGRDIMTAGRYGQALDLSYTQSNVYVVDRRDASEGQAAQHRVQVFKRNGDFLLPLGARKLQRDTTLVVDGIAVDTTLKVWSYDQLSDPRSVAVYGNRGDRAGTSDETVFVSDGNLIRLFSLSVSEDDLPSQ